MERIIKPFRDFVHIRPIYNRSTSGKIILLEGERPLNQKQFRGKVLAIGPEVYDLKVGDEVLFQDYGVKLEDKTTMVGFGYVDCVVLDE